MGNNRNKSECTTLKTWRECARSNYKQRNAKNSHKSKMADASSDILFDSVRFVLSNWAVLQLAVEHGFGGKDTAEKAEWMLNVINQVLRENGQYSYFQASQSIHVFCAFLRQCRYGRAIFFHYYHNS